MLRVHVPLDPTKTGLEAEVLETSLRKLIVGQDAAIEQIVRIYQTYLAGMTAPGVPLRTSCFWAPPDRARRAPWKPPPRRC